jgi:protein-L-isoaspartate(D-aspartate) O-methyltransferase
MNHSDDLRVIPQPGAIERSAEEYLADRLSMVESQLRRRDIKDAAVLKAMGSVPRHEFVPPEFRYRAYEDVPLPIGEGQTISQPYMVASIAAALHLSGGERVLEVGAGCGYHAAILANLGKEIFAIEYRDGTLGLPEFAPFDAIVISAGAPAAPAPLLAQLSATGRMVVPVGDLENQELQLILREHGTFRKITLEPCRFVPLVGAYGWKE